jgi:hypothetical protein
MNEMVKYESAPRMDLEYFNTVCDIAYKSKCYGNIAKETMLNLCITAHDLGIPISKALNGGFHIVQGKIVMSAGLMNDMIRKAGHSLQIKKSDDKCIIIGKRKDNGDMMHEEYSMKDAELAGLLSSPTWKKHPKNMLYSRAMTNIARALFSDVIGNAYCEDEGHEIQNIPAHKRPEIDPFGGKTIEVENAIPKIEQKPEIPVIPVESLLMAMDVMGCKSDIESIKEFISELAKVHEKPEQLIIANAMKNDERIASFIGSYEIWASSKAA